MASTLMVEVVSAEGEIFAGEAEMLIAPADMGEVGITPGHSQMITTLLPGQLRVIRSGEPEINLYVEGGILEVQPFLATVLSDTTVRAEDLDEHEILRQREEARKMLADQNSNVDFAKIELELMRTAAQLKVVQTQKVAARH